MSHILENFLSEKNKKFYYIKEAVENSDIKFTTQNNKIIKIYQRLGDSWLICCGRTDYRDKTIQEVYNFLDTIKYNYIIEAGVGCGAILEYLPENKDITIVELNKKIVDYYSPLTSIKIIQDDIWDYIRSQNACNTIFIVRLTSMGFNTFEEYRVRILGLFKNNFNKNNYYVFECKGIDFNIPNLVKIFENIKSKTYIVKLDLNGLE